MGKFFSTPITEEQRKARENKIKELEERQRKIEADLIIADLLEKISKLEAKTK